MDNTFTGLNKITDRIRFDAEKAAEETMNEAKSAAADYRQKVMAEASSRADMIVKKAQEEADQLTENALSGRDAKARSELLRMKNSCVDEALAKAKARFVALAGEERIAAYASLLGNAVNECLSDGARAVMLTNAKDADTAREAVGRAHFKKNVSVSAETTDRPLAAGFVVKCGDIEIDCGADALFASVDASLQKEVLALLFRA